jgi:hypothetical protein
MIGVHFDIKVRRSALGRNFDVATASAARETYNATWNLCTNSLLTAGPKKTTEIIYRVGRSQDLQDAK